ncbi:4-hydroxy-tetrahydrodipicolinate synthase [Silvimonas soli]|uniref:4-hydroxy-tetrahydrodipicolinate synthase n=1 Tax=Silvimonas soli TaxID=2980100 RepID=UPI0024B3A9EC|nr:4-hydroxy-tetrahydrodipicolinate synthase [Silvimonas soli]
MMTVPSTTNPVSPSTTTTPVTAFSGIWVPLVTPFHHGKLDLPAMQKLTLDLLARGVDGLVVCGTTGEAATQTEAEQFEQLAVVKAAAGKTPVLMGISGSNTAEMTGLVERAERHGADGLLISAPAYVRPSQAGIRLHFEMLVAATRLPIVLYNIPYRTGVNIEIDTVKALSANPQFVAIKESGGGNLAQLTALIEQTPLKVLSGEDHLIFITACLGGHGGISAAAHIRPDLYRKMLAHVGAGELPQARAIAQALAPLIKLLFSEPNPAPVKAALAMLGLIRNELRLPMTPASSALRQQLEQILPTVMAL